jgi:nucleoside-diphosphate-sugar epimerase
VRTVVVTGAAGELGRRVVQRLAGRPDIARVVALDLQEGSVPAGNVEWQRVDLAAPPGGVDALDAAVRDASAVIHLAWVSAPVDQDAAESNRLVLQRVLGSIDRAADRAADPTGDRATEGGPVLVHLSSGTVYGAWPDNPVPLTEDVPLRPNPQFGFAITKAEAERQVVEWSEAHPNITVSILRPCVVVGAPHHPLYQALGGTRLARTDEGARQVQYLHVDDLADAVVFAWDNALSGVFNVAPDRGTGEAIARALAGGVAQVALPARLAHALADWSWHLVRDGTPKEAQAYARYPWVLAPDRLRAAGWEANYSSEEALVATDERSHWDDLPPGKRQEFTLLLGIGGVVAALAAATAAVLGVRRLGNRRR